MKARIKAPYLLKNSCKVPHESYSESINRFRIYFFRITVAGTISFLKIILKTPFWSNCTISGWKDEMCLEFMLPFVLNYIGYAFEGMHDLWQQWNFDFTIYKVMFGYVTPKGIFNRHFVRIKNYESNFITESATKIVTFCRVIKSSAFKYLLKMYK